MARNRFIIAVFFNQIHLFSFTISCQCFASRLKRSLVYYSLLKISDFLKLLTFDRGFIQFPLCTGSVKHMDNLLLGIVNLKDVQTILELVPAF